MTHKGCGGRIEIDEASLVGPAEDIRTKCEKCGQMILNDNQVTFTAGEIRILARDGIIGEKGH